MSRIYEVSVFTQKSVLIEAEDENNALERAKDLWLDDYRADYYFQPSNTDDWSVEESDPENSDSVIYHYINIV